MKGLTCPNPILLRAMMRSNAGASLIEVIVAVTILSIAGVTVVTAVAESTAAVRRAREADLELRAAGAFMEAIALWTREDLDRRLGDRRQGNWRLIIERPFPTLYSVALTDSTGSRVLLSTSLYRPLSVDDD